jgi:hypothetical protein
MVEDLTDINPNRSVNLVDELEAIYKVLVKEKMALKSMMTREVGEDNIYNAFIYGTSADALGFYEALGIFFDMSNYIIDKDKKYKDENPTVKTLLREIPTFLDDISDGKLEKKKSTVKKGIKHFDDYMPHAFRKNLVIII